MSSRIYYSPFIPTFSGNGLPVANARLYFFYTGTTDLAPIFQDEALTIPMGNPVVSDGAARYPNIYLNAAITYRVRETGKDGTPLAADVDPYIPGTAPGTATGGFIQAGTGAVLRTLQDKGRENVSALDFGAPADGVSDDSPAITLAIAALVDGGTLVLTAGHTFRMESPVSLNGKKINIVAIGAVIMCQGTAAFTKTDHDNLLTIIGGRWTGAGNALRYIAATTDQNPMDLRVVGGNFENTVCALYLDGVRENQIFYCYFKTGIGIRRIRTVNSSVVGCIWNACTYAINDGHTDERTVAISGISKANPGAVTTTVAHGLTGGEFVSLNGVLGMVEANNPDSFYTVTVLTATTFSIATNTTGFTTWTGGGLVYIRDNTYSPYSAGLIIMGGTMIGCAYGIYSRGTDGVEIHGLFADYNDTTLLFDGVEGIVLGGGYYSGRTAAPVMRSVNTGNEPVRDIRATGTYFQQNYRNASVGDCVYLVGVLYGEFTGCVMNAFNRYGFYYRNCESLTTLLCRFGKDAGADGNARNIAEPALSTGGSTSRHIMNNFVNLTGTNAVSFAGVALPGLAGNIGYITKTYVNVTIPNGTTNGSAAHSLSYTPDPDDFYQPRPSNSTARATPVLVTCDAVNVTLTAAGAVGADATYTVRSDRRAATI